MKLTTLLTAILVSFGMATVAQTNIFPADGNVGIGTTSPTVKLEVMGKFVLGSVNLDPNGSEGNLSFLQNSGKMLFGWNRTQGDGETDFISNRGAGSRGGFAFYNYDNDGSQRQLMFLYGDGNVGIGTSNPREKLSVNGKIRAHEIKVETSNWPDYVFEKSYVLPSLSETKNYIKIHKHLPDMPSAETIAQNGQELGDIQVKLLKKVEELTLHLIRLEELNAEQKKRIDIQDKAIKALNKSVKK